MVFEVQIIGSNSAVAAHQRHPSAQIVKIHDEYLLIDCGEGTQNRMRDFGAKSFKIGHIFISHLHGDHYFGLIGLLTTYHLLGRKRPLHIYGPSDLKKIIDLQLEAGGRVQLNYPVQFYSLEYVGQELLYQSSTFSVFSFPMLHRIPTSGFVIKELPKKRKIIKAKIEGKDFDHSVFGKLLEGQDVRDKTGFLYANEELTSPAQPPKSYAYCSDTVYNPDVVQYIEKVDLLYHEATFLDEQRHRAKETYHSTSKDAAKIAAMAKVGKLIVGHFSSKYKDLTPLLEEVKSAFPNAELAIEGQIFKV